MVATTWRQSAGDAGSQPSAPYPPSAAVSRAPAPGAVWRGLNERRRAYLRVAFALDQETEAGVRLSRARGFHSHLDCTRICRRFRRRAGAGCGRPSGHGGVLVRDQVGPPAPPAAVFGQDPLVVGAPLRVLGPPGCPLAAGEGAADMGAEEHKAVIRRYVDALNAGDDAALLALVHPDAVFHYGEHTVRGREAYARGNAAGRRAFPDWSLTLEALLAEGDLVALRGTIRATHGGPFDAGPKGIIPASGAPEAVTQQALARVRDGRLVEAWVERDGLRLLRQLGALPPADAHGPPVPAQTASLEHEGASAPSLLPEVDTAYRGRRPRRVRPWPASALVATSGAS
jgi:predicted ester cyclase